MPQRGAYECGGLGAVLAVRHEHCQPQRRGTKSGRVLTVRGVYPYTSLRKLVARRRECAPGRGGCQRLCGLLLDSKRPTPRLQSLLLSVHPHLAAFSHRLRQCSMAARAQRKDCSTP